MRLIDIVSCRRAAKSARGPSLGGVHGPYPDILRRQKDGNIIQHRNLILPYSDLFLQSSTRCSAAIMAAPMSTMRPLGCWNLVRRGLKGHELGRRLLYTIYSPPKDKLPFPKDLPQQFMRQIPNIHRPDRGIILFLCVFLLGATRPPSWRSF